MMALLICDEAWVQIATLGKDSILAICGALVSIVGLYFLYKMCNEC